MYGPVPSRKEVDIRKKAGDRERRKRATGGNEKGQREGVGVRAQRSPSTDDYQINEVGGTKKGTCERE